MSKTKKCIFCGTQHSNKRKDNFEIVSDVCFRCGFALETLEQCLKAINRFVPTGASKPCRKVTIGDVKIEKI